MRFEAIDPARKTITLNNGSKLSYDRLVVAPGIAFRDGALEGYDDAAMEIMPHAWNAAPQTRLLSQQLESMEDGGLFVLVAPGVEPGVREGAHLLDIAPTVLELLGLDRPAAMRGHSLLG